MDSRVLGLIGILILSLTVIAATTNFPSISSVQLTPATATSIQEIESILINLNNSDSVKNSKYSVELWALKENEKTNFENKTIISTTSSEWAFKNNNRSKQFFSMQDSMDGFALNLIVAPVIKTQSYSCKTANWPETAPNDSATAEAKTCWNNYGKEWMQYGDDKTKAEYSLNEFAEFVSSLGSEYKYYLVMEFSENNFIPTPEKPVKDIIFELNFTPTTLSLPVVFTNECSKCNSIQQCLACINQRIVKGLWGNETTEPPELPGFTPVT
ncbi:MAG: hypothetical protein JW703_02330 [Candidatus Diapherotrites archaeon]|nr:hypothetical protein [Candidatus Diapherotrites archaeon]